MRAVRLILPSKPIPGVGVGTGIGVGVGVAVGVGVGVGVGTGAVSVSVSVAELLPGFGSVTPDGDITLAVLDRVPEAFELIVAATV